MENAEKVRKNRRIRRTVMDNFLDKLAERYNAQDMIRANSQAETTQLKSLEDQVEAYETVLQEMRKLNYKNSELTEKMYALVDESLEKVRNLQIEASEGTANAETISREMNDAVSRAVSEAMGSMDEGVARTVAESLENALLKPTAELKASTEDVRNSMAAVQSSADTMRSATDEVKSGISEITGRLDESAQDREQIKLKLQAALDKLEKLEGFSGSATAREAADVAVDLEPVRMDLAETTEALESVKNDIAAAGRTLDTISETLSTSSTERREILDAVRALADERGSLEETLKDTGTDLNERFFAIQQTSNGIEESLASFAAAVQTLVENAQELDPAMDQRLGKIEGSISDLKDSTKGIDPEMSDRLTQILSSIEELRQPSNLEDLTQESLSALAQVSAQTQDSVSALRASVDEIKASVDSAAGGVGEMRAKQDSLAEQQAALVQQSAQMAQQQAVMTQIAEQQAAMVQTQAQIAERQAAMEQKQTEMSELQTAMAQQQVNEGGDDIRSAITDLTASKTEILTHLRNLKSSTDEGKTTYKSALDTAIYGLKQDNKELIEFLSRINAAVEHMNSDAERAQREAEEQARLEQEKQALEERFKLAEDFMHKESVKVYRNVQAVINEKEDKRREGVDGGLDNVDRSVKRVKAVAVLSLIVGLINLAITVLSFFNLL